jgi:ribosomal protein S8E
MKRRNFIISASVVTVGLPVAYYIQKHKWNQDPVSMPDLLGRFCEEKILKKIGTKYRQLVPAENEKRKLTDLILTDISGKKIKTSDKLHIIELIDQKIHEEFAAYNIMIIDGWVITTTEARQCALFSLI